MRTFYLVLILIGCIFLVSCRSGQSEVFVTDVTNRNEYIELQHFEIKKISFLIDLGQQTRDEFNVVMLLLKNGKTVEYYFNDDIHDVSLARDDYPNTFLLKNSYSKIMMNIYITDLDYLTIKGAPKGAYRYSFDISNKETFCSSSFDVPQKRWTTMELRILNKVKHPVNAIPLFCYIELEHEYDNIDNVQIENILDIWKLSHKRNIIVAFLTKRRKFRDFLTIVSILCGQRGPIKQLGSESEWGRGLSFKTRKNKKSTDGSEK